MDDPEFLERALAFWEKVASGDAPSASLRNEFIQLLAACRAQGTLEAALLVRRARRGMAVEGTDPVGRYVLAQLEEELRRRAHGLPPRDANALWLHETPQ